MPFGHAESFLRARVSLTIDGQRHVLLSPWSLNPIEPTQVPAVVPPLTNLGGPIVGNNVQAWPPTDVNGGETAAEEIGGWVYRFESAANEALTEDVQVLRTANISSWTLQASDAGRYIRAVVEFTDDQGFDEVAISNVIGPVVDPNAAPDEPDEEPDEPDAPDEEPGDAGDEGGDEA